MLDDFGANAPFFAPYNFDETTLKKDIQTLKKQGFSDKDIAKILSSIKNYPKNQVYQLALQL